MQLSQKHQKLALAAAAGVAAMLVIRRKLRTKIRAAFDIGSGVLESLRRPPDGSCATACYESAFAERTKLACVLTH